MSAEMAMWVSGLVIVIAVAIALWNPELYERASNVWLAVAIVALVFFVWAQRQAEKEHELKHAAEHRAVQEQVESMREL